MKVFKTFLSFLKDFIIHIIMPPVFFVISFLLINLVGKLFGKTYEIYFFIFVSCFIISISILCFIRYLKKEFIGNKEKDSNLTKKEFFAKLTKQYLKAVSFFILILLGLVIFALISKEYFLNIMFFVFLGAFILLLFLKIVEKKI